MVDSFRREGREYFNSQFNRGASELSKGSDRFLYRIYPSSSANYRRVVPSAFRLFGSSDDGRTKGDFTNFCDNSTFTKLQTSTEQAQADHEAIERKEIPFIDFLGVGVSSS